MKIQIGRPRNIAVALIASVLNLALSISPAYSAPITVSSTLTSYATERTGVNQSFSFTVATTSSIKQIDVRFSTNSTGFDKPTNIDLTSATLASGTILGSSGWSLSTSNASTGLLSINRSSSVLVNSGAAGAFTIQNITNPAFGDCQNITGTLADTCYVRMTTYSDSGVTSVDEGVASYIISEDPSLSFEVTGVASGSVHNGITTNVSTTGLKLEFGNIQTNTVHYAAQQLTISTNAPHGYIVTARLSDGLRGAYEDSEIDPFGATNAEWSNPQIWTTPNGTAPNDNTGWIGANTTDTRVQGWESNTQNKFGPISTFDHIVAKSTGPDRAGSVVYVTFALEVNGAQPADDYSASVIYNVQASY